MFEYIIFGAVVLGFILLMLAIHFQESSLGYISAFTLMCCGLYIIINGIETVSSFMTESLGIIILGVGFLITAIIIKESLNQ